MNRINVLRIVHGAFALYFIACLLYLYYVVLVGGFGLWLWVALGSLLLEGFAVFVLNKGDCPLIHIQKKLGDEKPFFELLFPPGVAKKTVPVLTAMAWLAVALLAVRFLAQ